jgi:DNA-binding NarL/FixJ family response regulator
MRPNSQGNILLVEDNAPTAALICTILADADFQGVSVAGTARQAEAAIARQGLDLVLLDLGLPDGDGVTVIEWARASAFAKPIVVLTGATRDDQVLRALRAGADGYLFKEDLDHALVPGLREIARGGAPLSRGAARAALVALRQQNEPASATASAPPPKVASNQPTLPILPSLTKRELQVLESLSFGGGYAEVARDLGVEINTVRTHVRALYGKLGVENRAEAVNLGWAHGLLRQPT